MVLHGHAMMQSQEGTLTLHNAGTIGDRLSV
jgi:hypothetical protein